jgi:rhodanese-related sulfurtransferase
MHEVDNLDKEKTYFVYCQTGVRSATAMSIMKNIGYKKVFNLEGGIKAWINNGKKIV